MSYEMTMLYLTIGAAAIFVLVLLTNIITQVFKNVINKENCPPQAVVFVIAEILTFLAVAIICTVLGMQVLWYYWVLAFIIGILVSYGAMFGYDNLYKQIFVAMKALIAALFGKEAGE